MYILKNSVKNIGRNKGRNFILGIIILGMIISTVIGFSINTTTNEIIKDYKNRFGSEVSIAPDMEKISSNNGAMVSLKPIDPKMNYEFAESEYIKEAIFKSQLGVISNNIKAIDEDEEEENQNMGMVVSLDGETGEPIAVENPKFMLLGSSTVESLEEFKTGKRKIVEGEIYKEKDECIISKDLAELNNIKVGDKIKVKNTYSSKGEELEDYELKVAGIYLDSTEEYNGMPFKSAFMNKRNEILTSIETIQSMAKDEDIYVDAKFYLKSPDMLKAFEEEIRAKGLPDDYIVTTDEASYNRIVGPVEGLGSITIIFLGVVLALGSVILILLNTLSIRERKYEIGVLRAIGMKKGKVALGLIYESLIITVICLGIGIGVGSMVSQPVSNILLEKQVEAQKSSQPGVGGMAISIGSTLGSVEDTISNIDVTLNGKALLEVAGVSMLIVLVSSLVGVSYITKYEPSKILRERG